MTRRDSHHEAEFGLTQYLGVPLSRRQVLRGSLAAAAGLSSLALLAACAEDEAHDDEEPVVEDEGDEETPEEDDESDDEDDEADDAPAGDESAGGELIYAIAWPIDILDPNIAGSSAIWRMAFQMFDPLVWQPQPGEFIPGLANEWEVNDTADQYTFRFRDDVTFHDGTPFTAEAVKFNFDKIVDPESRAQGAFSAMGSYESSEVVDDYEIVVNFESPYAPFLDSTSLSKLAPGSPTAQEELGDDYGTNPVGTGPFMFESLEGDNEVRMVKNTDYNWAPTMFEHQGPPHLDAIVWRSIPEPATRLAALRSGEVHMIEQVPTHEVEGLKADDSFEVIESILPGSGWSLMNNVENPPNDDILVRQALQWGVDKEGMIQAIWQGQYEVSCSPLTSITFGYDPSTCDIYSYDPERAGELLDEAGWVMGDDGFREKDGERLVMGVYYRSDQQTFIDLATFLEAQFREIGIEADLHGLAATGYFDAVRAGEHNIQFWWGPGTDPDSVFRVLFHSSNADGGTNRNRYRDDEVDELIDEAAGETNLERREQLYIDLQHRLLEEAIMVFFSEPTEIYAVSTSDVELENLHLLWTATDPLFYDVRMRM